MEISRFFSTFGRMKQICFHFSLDFPLDFFDFLRQVFRSPPMRSRFWKYNILKALRFCWFSPCSTKYYWFYSGNIQKMLWALDFQNIKNLTGKKRHLAVIPSSAFLLLPVCFLSPFVIRAAISHSCLGYLCSENLSARRVNGSTPFLLYNMRWFGKYNSFLRKSNIFISFMRLEREKSIVFLIFFNF